METAVQISLGVIIIVALSIVLLAVTGHIGHAKPVDVRNVTTFIQYNDAELQQEISELNSRIVTIEQMPLIEPAEVVVEYKSDSYCVGSRTNESGLFVLSCKALPVTE